MGVQGERSEQAALEAQRPHSGQLLPRQHGSTVATSSKFSRRAKFQIRREVNGSLVPMVLMVLSKAGQTHPD